jgi:catechol 2,3-dioxygenase-like lactoylglutathione lyase family enzyme
MTYRYHHLHLICSNLQQTASFFTSMLGGKLIERKKFGTADGAVIDLDGIIIFLRTSRENDDILGDSSQQRYGYDHLGLEVADLDAVYTDLRGKGVIFTISPTKGASGKTAFLRGPDGITIELFQSVS